MDKEKRYYLTIKKNEMMLFAGNGQNWRSGCVRNTKLKKPNITFSLICGI
jgi:hypothetical protein